MLTPILAFSCLLRQLAGALEAPSRKMWISPQKNFEAANIVFRRATAVSKCQSFCKCFNWKQPSLFRDYNTQLMGLMNNDQTCIRRLKNQLHWWQYLNTRSIEIKNKCLSGQKIKEWHILPDSRRGFLPKTVHDISWIQTILNSLSLSQFFFVHTRLRSQFAMGSWLY